MENNTFEFRLTLCGRVVGTSFKQIEELVVPYFKDVTKINFHNDGYGNIDIENKYWELDICLSKMLIEDIEEDYSIGAGYKGSFKEGEKAVKEFASYLSEHGFVYSLEYEDTNNKEYLIQQPNWSTFFDERKQKSYPEYDERQRRREQAKQNSKIRNNRSFWQKVKDWFKP
jgi:hypothetical protein